MEINFVKSGSVWAAEFEVTADFNIHIEGVIEGDVSIFQRGTSSGSYAYVRQASHSTSYGDTYDADFSALVYPKYIKVECPEKPSVAVVTYNA